MSGRKILRDARRDRAKRRTGGGLRTLGLLAGVLACAFIGAAVLGRAAEQRRTAEAPATIVSQRLQVGGGTKEQLPRGFHLQYTYVVAGRSHAGAAFRAWSNVAETRPKVCYDPANPDDHLLVAGSEPCG